MEIAGVVDQGSLNSLHTQSAAMKLHANKHLKSKQISWKFVITPSNPIMFREAETCSGIKPDIFCIAEFKFKPELQIERLNTVIRLWSNRKERAHRDHLDSIQLKDNLKILGWRRVMLRLHFDYLPQSNLPAPVYHMQVGGRENQQNEYCWYPDDIDVPRLLCLPVDLFSACEIVVANFFPSKYFELSREGNWLKPIKWSEEYMIQDEMRLLLKSIDSKHTVFRSMISDLRYKS